MKQGHPKWAPPVGKTHEEEQQPPPHAGWLTGAGKERERKALPLPLIPFQDFLIARRVNPDLLLLLFLP